MSRIKLHFLVLLWLPLQGFACSDEYKAINSISPAGQWAAYFNGQSPFYGKKNGVLYKFRATVETKSTIKIDVLAVGTNLEGGSAGDFTRSVEDDGMLILFSDANLNIAHQEQGISSQLYRLTFEKANPGAIAFIDDVQEPITLRLFEDWGDEVPGDPGSENTIRALNHRLQNLMQGPRTQWPPLIKLLADAGWQNPTILAKPIGPYSYTYQLKAEKPKQ